MPAPTPAPWVAQVEPAGHFFSAGQTMERYASERATEIWKQKLAEFESPVTDPSIEESLKAYISRRAEQGGAQFF